MSNKNLRDELSRFSNKTEQPLRLYSGALGIYIGGKQYVDVPNRPGFVYVRLSSNISELIQAHNQVVSPVYDLPVLLTKTKTYYEVFGRDVEQWANYDTSNSSFLPKHGFQHEFDPDNGGGGDLVFVHGEQFYPLMGFPSGTDGAGNILIAPYRYYANSSWHYAGNTGTPDLLQYKPTGSANAVLLLVGLTVNTGNPFVKIGTEFDASITGASALTDYVPTSLTVSNEIPGTIVRLVTGTDVITWANIYDARQYMGILQTSANSFIALTDAPSSYIGQADKLVTVKTDESGLEFRINTGSFGGGGGGGTIGIYGEDEGASLGTGTVLNVVGADISLSISGTTLTLSHTDPTGTPHSFLDLTDTPDSYSGQGGKYAAVNAGATALEFVTAPVSAINVNGTLAQDEGTPLGTGTTFNFVGDGVIASISGSVIQVLVAGSTAQPTITLLKQTGTAGTPNLSLSNWYSTDYDEYIIELRGFLPVTNAVDFYIRASSDNGATFITGSYYLNNHYLRASSGDANINSTTSQFVTRGAANISNSSAYSINGQLRLYLPASPIFHRQFLGDINFLGTAPSQVHNFFEGVFLLTGTSINALQFFFSSGNMVTGSVKIYGVP